MELFGRGYVIEHCISALNYDRERERERKSFEMYVTDALMAIAENTTHLVGMDGVVDYGKSLQTRWIDMLDDTPIEPQETDDRPCEEIAQDIFARIRGNNNECI